MMYFYRIWCLLLLLISAWPLPGQMPHLRTHTPKGLGNIQFTTVFQDSQGWLWLGAESGLFRYDGTEFYPVHLPPGADFNPAVTAIFQFEDKLWIGFQSGKIAVMPVLNSIFSAKSLLAPSAISWWEPEEGTPSSPISGFAADLNGGLWIATYGEGLYTWRKNRMYLFNAADEDLSSNDIYAVAADGQGRIWAATDGGISICAMPENGKKYVQLLNRKDSLPDEIVTALMADPQGNIWIGTHEQGVCHYNILKKTIDYRTANWTAGAVTALALIGNRLLYIGTSDHGMAELDIFTNKYSFWSHREKLPKGRIAAVVKDREGWIWTVPAHAGILQSFNSLAMQWPSPLNDSIQTVLTTRTGWHWAGTPSGLFLQQPAGNWKQMLPGKQNILTLWEAQDGTIWVGTFGNGIFLITPGGKLIRHLTETQGLSNGSVFSIDGNEHGVWAATLAGVTRFDSNGNLPITLEQELGLRYVYRVFVDSKARVWFGVDGSGLAMWDNGRFQSFQEAAGTKLHSVYSLAEDDRGRIWIGTDRDGLFCFDGRTFQTFTVKSHGLHAMSLNGIVFTPDSRLLIAYENGFDFFDPETGRVAFFDEESGCPPFKPSLNALYVDFSGQIWAGGLGGILRFSGFDEKKFLGPQPSIVSVALFGDPIDFYHKHSFGYQEDYLTFSFTGLWFSNPEAISYRYRLEGFDPDWTVTKDPFASYPNLPPGPYTFRIQTSANGKFEEASEAAWPFTIQAPFWQKWWFIALGAIGSVLFLFWFVRLRERQVAREALIRRQKIETEFEILKSQINPHFLFNSFNTLISIIEESPENAVEYVEHLSDFYRSILVYREKDLIPLQEEMAIINNFLYLLMKRYEKNIELITDIQDQNGLIIPLSLQLLVENAVKHNIISKNKKLKIEIFTTPDFYVVVRNNLQPKIKPEIGANFGLFSLKQRYALIGTRPIRIEQDEKHFTVGIPLL